MPQSVHSSVLDDPQARAWLEAVPLDVRNVTAQAHHQAVRVGGRTPADVRVLARRRLALELHDRESDEARQRQVRAAIEAIDTDREAHARYCEWVRAWEALPPAERARRKAEQDTRHREAFLRSQPPTEKQLGLLDRLGHRGPAPESKAAASALLDALLQEARK